MFILLAYWLLCALANTAQAEFSSGSVNAMYDGAQVWSVKLRTFKDAKLIQKLMNDHDISLWKLNPEKAVFLVHPGKKVKVYRQLGNRDLNHTVVILNVQRRVDEQEIRPGVWDHKALRRGHRMKWSDYPTVEIINEYMDYLTKNYPSVCKQKSIGKSVKNETIKMVTISNGNPRNKGILLISGTHAREWNAITSALVVMREIATNFDKQPKHVRDITWYIIPLLNPDGYRFSYERDRFWRKNRSYNHKSTCRGVDINRNFGSGWHVKGITELNPCHELYSGPHAFSEPETIALRELVRKLKGNLSAMVDFHAFGQDIFFPWSHKPDETVDYTILNATAAEMSSAIQKFQSQKYKYGQTYHNIYPASGSLLDWMYSAGIKLSYVIEGRDTGVYGFLMPSIYIQESGQEMLVAVTRLAKVLGRQLVARGRDDYPWF